MKNKGFTLIELVIIFSVIAIIIGVSVFAIKALRPTLQLSAAARDMLTNLRYTQQISVTEQDKYCIQFSVSGSTYNIFKCGGTVISSTKNLPPGITIKSVTFTNNTTEYNPYGAVKESGTIILENSDGKEKQIDIAPSGFAKISH